MKCVILAFSAVMMLAACDDNNSHKAAAVHDVQFYLNHSAERKTTLNQCHNNPGELRRKPNCKNASAAERKARTQERLDALDAGT